MPLIPPLISTGETLATLRTKLARQLRNRSDVTPAMLADYINDAYRDITVDIQLPEAQTSVEIEIINEVHQYLIPSDLLYITNVAIRDEVYSPAKAYDLDPIDIADYRARPVRYGVPKFWLRVGRTLALWPYPSGDEMFMVLDGIGVVDKLTEDLHSPVINVSMHGLLLILARCYAYDDLGQPDKAAVAYNVYLSRLRSKVDTLAEERAYSSPKVIVPRSENHLRSVMTGEDWHDAILE